MQRRTLVGGLVAASCIVPRLAGAQDAAAAWPSRPVRLLVGFPAGGSVDTVARLVQPRLQAALGQPVVVENRPGATGSLAAAEAARSGADGHAWLVVSDGHAVIPSVMPLPFDARRDLAPVAMLGRGAW